MKDKLQRVQERFRQARNELVFAAIDLENCRSQCGNNFKRVVDEIKQTIGDLVVAEKAIDVYLENK